jgi:hypothetical protein
MARDGFMRSPNQGPAAEEGRLLVIHTAEGARTARALGAWFSQKTAQTSSHDGIDGSTQIGYVDYPQQAWTVRTGNAISENVELCGFAGWPRDQWLSTGVVDGVTNPRAMLRRCSRWIAERAAANNIPLRKLTPAQVKAGWSGVIGHVDWTIGMRDGTHSDPGPNFPWDIVIADAKDNNEEDDMTVAGELVRTLLDTMITREGLPATDPRAGQEVPLVKIFAWSDANIGRVIEAADRNGAAIAALAEEIDQLRLTVAQLVSAQGTNR